MIDVTQWRASIGLWHYCQAASSRPANGRQCHSFKDSKSKKIIALLLLFISFSLHMMKLNSIPPTGIYSKDLVYICMLYIAVDNKQKYENVVTFSPLEAHSPNA